jgi:type IV secretory pathway TrbD component
MTEAQPPLIVRIDRERVRAARARERRILVIGATIEFVVTAGIVAAAIWITANSATFDWFVIGFLGVLAVGSALFAISLLSPLRKKGSDYWNAGGLPDVAFVVHGDGVTITNPETNTTFEAPWAKLKAFEVKRLHTRFVFEPGVVDKKYRDQFWFGRATLDQDAATIRRALHALSGRAY